jgi:hypothetical protein
MSTLRQTMSWNSLKEPSCARLCWAKTDPSISERENSARSPSTV